jgi:hypothetical protein
MGWNFLYNKKDPTKLWTWYLKNKLTMWFLVKYSIMMTLKIRCDVLHKMKIVKMNNLLL